MLVIFAMAMIAYSTTFPSLHGQAYGPSLFPILIGCALLACGLVLIVRGVQMYRRQSPINKNVHPDTTDTVHTHGWIQWGDWMTDSARRFTMLLVPGLLILYILTSDFIGFIPLSVIVMSLLLYRLGSSPLGSLLIAVITTLVLQLLFADVLLVPLPPGLLLHWLG